MLPWSWKQPSLAVPAGADNGARNGAHNGAP